MAPNNCNDTFTSEQISNAMSTKSSCSAIIFFDWDDTLMASSRLAQMGLCPKYINEQPDIPTNVQNQLRKLEKIVVSVLEKALLYGRVVIVTAAESGWVELSASLYLPRVLSYLNTSVKVISARSTYESLYPGCPNRWKIEAFDREVYSIWPMMEHSTPTHVISVGDGPTEREALLNIKQHENLACLGKSMKFIGRPSINELCVQLELIHANMDHLCTFEGDLDLQITWEMLRAKT
uniref:Uncharacterized protein AlNc14C3G417 n=1 Tax=Albugo laibachii Nc14 TaxID=890382 RepID=F0VZT8_9STRA|nr:conserved hypothetical protein [Albugo laibachii Nc14]|eukprot:CCA14309.1 conserved hypothetical protein [Albugo laibachii Nc14]